jgi:hypothetical protein
MRGWGHAVCALGDAGRGVEQQPACRLLARSFRPPHTQHELQVRIIVVKLADRLHNMRTMDSMPQTKQRRIAQVGGVCVWGGGAAGILREGEHRGGCACYARCVCRSLLWPQRVGEDLGSVLNAPPRLACQQETLAVFAPLARLLGLYSIKEELEELSFRWEGRVVCAGGRWGRAVSVPVLPQSINTGK